jgi:hypothetical protein
LRGFRLGFVGVLGGGVEVVRIIGKGAGVVEVRLVNGGLGRIGLFDGFSPLIHFLRRDIGQGGPTHRLEGFGHGRSLALVVRPFGGWSSLDPVFEGFGAAFEPFRIGRFESSSSLRRDAVGG